MRSLYDAWHAIQDRADFPREEHVGLHDLRRSFGTNLAKHVEAAVLQRLMRHRNIATTLTFYVDASRHMAASIADLPPMLDGSAKPSAG